MIRNTALLASVITTALLAGGLAGCHAEMQIGNEPAHPKPAPPPPPAATAAPAPAPAPAPTPTPAPAATPAPAPAPAPAAAPAAKVETKGGELKLPGNIVFDTDKANLKAGSGSEVVLDQLKQYMTEEVKKLAVLRIEGHTDNQGAADHNLELSGQRALTIKKWLIDHGIDATRLVAVGFGQTKPIAPNTTEEGRGQNRRTDFKIAETYDKKGKPVKYLGQDPLGGGKEFK